jgi:hypothetical protein
MTANVHATSDKSFPVTIDADFLDAEMHPGIACVDIDDGNGTLHLFLDRAKAATLALGLVRLYGRGLIVSRFECRPCDQTFDSTAETPTCPVCGTYKLHDASSDAEGVRFEGVPISADVARCNAPKYEPGLAGIEAALCTREAHITGPHSWEVEARWALDNPAPR